MRKIYTITALMVVTMPAFAQLDSLKTLGEVVITGQYKPQSVKNSVYQVKVITKDRIQKEGATRLQDVLNKELNIRFAQDNATGGSGITMMGLKGQNVKILIDGLPMVGRQGTSNEIDINQVDVNSIERIEIIEGPMSVIYGADALGGVINIITKKAGSSKISVNANIREETVGKEYGVQQGIHNQYADLTGRIKNWEIGGGFGYNYFGGYKGDSSGRELTWHWKDQITANGFVGYNGAKFNIRYRFDGLDEIITNPGNYTRYERDADDHFAPDQEYLSRRLMQQLQASYFVNSRLSFQAQSSYSTYSRSVSSTIVSQKTGRVSLDPATGSQSTVDFNGFTFRGTAQYKLSGIVSFQPGVDINMENGKGERLKAGNNKVNDYAFFLTSEITPVSKINIRPGIRVINNSVYDAPPVIPSINTKFSLSKELDLRLSYANGFRSPSLRELYFNFIDPNHKIIGNPGLKAETSNSFNGSLVWKKISKSKAIYNIVAGGFYNDVKNLIDYAFSSTSDTVLLANIFKSKTSGLNMTGSVKYGRWDVAAGFSYTGFYNDYSTSDKSLPTLQWSPEANASLGYTFSKIALDVNFFYKLTGRKPFYTTNSNQDIVLAEMKGYQMADLALNKKLFKYFNVSAGIRNLFDVKGITSSVAGNGVHSGNGITTIGYGRSYFAGLAFNWNKK